MGKPNRLFIILTAALVLIFALSIVGGSAQASPLNAPRTKTPTPGIATSTPMITPTATQASGAPIVSSTELTQGWSLISANNVSDSGAAISQTGYNVSTWYPITVPSTVLAGLVANNVYQNIYFGTNLQSVPDLTTQNWWYRGQFNAPAGVAGQQYWLRFKGVSYKAQIWLNGTQIDANAEGTLVIHEYNVTNIINKGGANALALLITPPASGCNDLSFCTVDWNPEPPDMMGGIWGKTFLDTTGGVALRDPYVKTVLPLPSTTSADLTIYVDAKNGTNSQISGAVSGTITKS